MPPSADVLFPTTIAGSLPKPSWLAEPSKLWAPWRLEGDELQTAKDDATLLALKLQEDAGIDIVSDGEEARQHFVHGFLEAVEGIDFGSRIEMGIRNNRYEAMCPTVIGPLRLRTRVHAREARLARAHTTRETEIHPARSDDHRRHHRRCLLRRSRKDGDGICGAAQRRGPRARCRRRQCDSVRRAGLQRLHGRGRRLGDRGAASRDRGLDRKTAVHICYGYGIHANIDWKATLGAEWRQYETLFPALAASRIDQVSLECTNSHVPLSLLGLLDGKDVLVGAIDVATESRDARGSRRRNRASG